MADRAPHLSASVVAQIALLLFSSAAILFASSLLIKVNASLRREVIYDINTYKFSNAIDVPQSGF